MTYTVWIHGQRIGETKLEIRRSAAKRAGLFHPTTFGLTVLPGVTDMFPALVAFGQFCKRRDIWPDSGGRESADHDGALAAFRDTPEGRRVIAAARLVGELVVRDPAGRLVAWESIAITDVAQFMALARASSPGPADDADEAAPADRQRFTISLTVAARRNRRDVFGTPGAGLSMVQPALDS